MADTQAANVQQKIANMGQNKKMVLVGAVVLTIIMTLVIVVTTYTRGKSLGAQIDLVKGIDQARAFEIVSKLNTQEIKSKIVESESPGKVNIQVFDKQFDEAAIALSRSDLLQDEGFNLFDKSDWAASDYDKRIKKTRAINGDLSRIISRVQGVKWATVRINIPEPQLFQEYETPTTATVQVELEDGTLSKKYVQSIVNLLVGYVPNLNKDNISIVDTSGATYSAVENEESVATSELLEENEKVNKIIQQRIEEYLTPLLGSNNFIVRVSSEISREKVEKTATTFSEGVIGQEQIGNEQFAGNNGASAGPPAPNAADGKGYSRTNRATTRYPSYETRNVKTPAGNITNIAVAVAINRGVPASVSITQLQEGIAAITSPTTKSSDVKVTIAEFAKGGSYRTAKNGTGKEVGSVFNQTGSFMSQISSMFSNLPIWAKIIVGIVSFILVMNILGGFARIGQPAPQQSTISQINQSKPKQQFQQEIPKELPGGFAQDPIGEITAQPTRQARPDISGIANELEQAAVQKPEFLANRLQLWLEEGSPSS